MALLVAISLWMGGVDDGPEIKRDEMVVFFPTIGRPVDEGAAWELEIHGWIFEPDWSAAASDLLGRALGIGEAELERDSAGRAVFRRRARAFLVDNERGKKIAVRVGAKTYTLPPSAPNGHFTDRLRLAAAEVRRLRKPAEGPHGLITFRAVTRKGDPRVFEGVVHLVASVGISVISDIDDTIKISAVRDRKALLGNTFLRRFRAVPGMADVFSSWSKGTGATFQYISASPWQLYRPLSDFLDEAGFPSGTFHLKRFRWKDRSFFDLFGSPEAYKVAVIEPILLRLPRRRFVLVGDSGEKDPEAYGTLARRHPQQVLGIFIRDVTGEGADARRYRTALAGLPEGTWRIFSSPAEIKDLTPRP